MSNSSDRLTTQSYWEKEWNGCVRKQTDSFIFSSLVKSKIDFTVVKTYFEVGCAPGSVMAYFQRCLGCQISGVDFSGSAAIAAHMAGSGIGDYKFYDCDFMEFTTKERYDLVASYGFIEHFQNTVEIFQKHRELVKDDGYLLVEVPNLRYFNKLLYYIFNKSLLKMHNLEIMAPEKLRALAGEMEIIYCDYYKTSALDFNPDNATLNNYGILKKLFLLFSGIIKFLKLDNIPNRFFSPYIVLIAKNTTSE